MPFRYEYYCNIDETTICTAAMNPNNRGIKKQHRLLSDRTNCFSELGNFLADYNWVGCLANDSVSGQNSISEFKTVSVLIIH